MLGGFSSLSASVAVFSHQSCSGRDGDKRGNGNEETGKSRQRKREIDKRKALQRQETEAAGVPDTHAALHLGCRGSRETEKNKETRDTERKRKRVPTRRTRLQTLSFLSSLVMSHALSFLRSHACESANEGILLRINFALFLSPSHPRAHEK